MTPVFGAGHHVVKVLSGTANLGRLLEACLADDPALMRRVCRQAGRTNPIRQANILERGVPAHPQTVLPLMLRANATQATIAFPNRLPELLTFQFHQQGAAACIALCNEMRPKIASNAEAIYYDKTQNLLNDINDYQFEELVRNIGKAIESLPESYRTAFVMHRFQGKSYKEIAEVSHVSPKTIDYRIQQSLKILRIKLKDYLPVNLLFIIRIILS